jgi:hypothetical protein
MPHTKKCGEATKTTQAQCKCPCGGLAHGLQNSEQPKFRYGNSKSDEFITNTAQGIAIELAVLCTSNYENEIAKNKEKPSDNLRDEYLITFITLHILCELLYILYELLNTPQELIKQVEDNLKQQIDNVVIDAHIHSKVIKQIVRATLDVLIDKIITLLEEASVTSGGITDVKYIIATLAILLCPEPENHDEIKKLTDEFTIQAKLQIDTK